MGLALVVVVLLLVRPDSRVELWTLPPEVSEDQREVRVSVFGGACESAEAHVMETDEQVVVTVRVTGDWFVTGCSDVGVVHTPVAKLDTPLGDRRLVDGAA